MSFQAQPINDKAITWADYNAHGCPMCATGNKEATTLVQGSGFALVVCSQCQVAYEINDEKALQEVE